MTIELEDLRRTLQEHAQSAPDGVGIIDAARTGAARRRRRRALGGAVAVAVVVALVLTVPALLAGRHGTSAPDHVATTPTPTTPPSTTPTPTIQSDRKPGDLTVEIAVGPDWYAMLDGAGQHFQFLTVRSKTAEHGDGADVVVFDPGSFDPAALLGGEQVNIEGKAGYYVGDLLVAPATTLPVIGGGQVDVREMRGPAVGFKDSSGYWVVVFAGIGFGGRDTLVDIARFVRIVPRHATPSPITFGWLPPGLALDLVSSRHPTDVEVRLMFGNGRQREVPNTGIDIISLSLGNVYPLSVMVTGRSGYDDSHMAGMGPPLMVNGVETWDGTKGGYMIPRGGRALIARSATCNYYVNAGDGSVISAADLQHVIAAARLGDCADRTTWAKPVA